MTEIITPDIAINCPYGIHSGLEYIKEDSGPTIAWPCK